MQLHRLSLGAALALAGQMLTQSAMAQPVPAPSQFATPQALTGKERLGPKWTDEQRIDNCKVPPAKRGAKPRPEGCPPTS